MIDPWLFSVDPSLLAALSGETDASAIPGAVVVDWEVRGKDDRQQQSPQIMGIDTQISADDEHALHRARAATRGRVICRINSLGDETPHEVARAIEGGANDVLVPMLRTPEQLDTVLSLAGDQLGVAIMVETVDAVRNAAELVARPVAFAFVGFMDLAIDRRTPSIFAPIVDGTLEGLAPVLARVPFGFGGLTVPGRGHPVPGRLLVGEMIRLGASFSFLRRSFIADLGGGAPGPAIRAIREAVAASARRTSEATRADRAELVRIVNGLNQRGSARAS
jgi:hypothetical protein